MLNSHAWDNDCDDDDDDDDRGIVIHPKAVFSETNISGILL